MYASLFQTYVCRNPFPNVEPHSKAFYCPSPPRKLSEKDRKVRVKEFVFQVI